MPHGSSSIAKGCRSHVSITRGQLTLSYNTQLSISNSSVLIPFHSYSGSRKKLLQKLFLYHHIQESVDGLLREVVFTSYLSRKNDGIGYGSTVCFARLNLKEMSRISQNCALIM